MPRRMEREWNLLHQQKDDMDGVAFPTPNSKMWTCQGARIVVVENTLLEKVISERQD